MSSSLFAFPSLYPSFQQFANQPTRPFIPEYSAALELRADPNSPASLAAIQRRREIFLFLIEFANFLRLPIRCAISAIHTTLKFFARHSNSNTSNNSSSSHREEIVKPSHYSMKEIASTALFLCSKIEECPRKLSDFSNYYHINNPELELMSESMIREKFMEFECEILFTLDFQLDYNVSTMEYLLFQMRILFGRNSISAEPIAITAMKILILSYSSSISLLYSPQVISTVSLFISSIIHRVDVNELSNRQKYFFQFPSQLPWWKSLSSLNEREFIQCIQLILQSVDDNIINCVFPGVGSAELLRPLKSNNLWISKLRLPMDSSTAARGSHSQSQTSSGHRGVEEEKSSTRRQPPIVVRKGEKPIEDRFNNHSHSHSRTSTHSQSHSHSHSHHHNSVSHRPHSPVRKRHSPSLADRDRKRFRSGKSRSRSRERRSRSRSNSWERDRATDHGRRDRDRDRESIRRKY